MGKGIISKELLVFASLIAAVIIAFAYYLFGITGIRVVFGIILVSIPFYMMLDKLELSDGEQFVFSALLGLTLFSSFVYLLGLAISFRISIIVVFIVLVAAAFVFRRYKEKKLTLTPKPSL